ncbi:MAG: GTP-binding protein [Candidatus Cryptobacteroides sp.]
MNMNEMPVLLLTGYLGSGKTTLVNHILTNEKGIRFAVIVNDIGEVNIDASLIQKGGVVAQKDDSLVALQNGCICCTLRTDLIEQIDELMASGKFDYIVIEASGICEPEPIAQTICSIPSLGPAYTVHGMPRLDCIVTVVDALRMQSEFGCGDDLKKDNIDEEDIENLVIQQIEFCNIILLNKVSDVSPSELERIRLIVRELNPGAEIIETDYANVDLGRLLNTWKFGYRSTEGSAGWVRGLETPVSEEDHHHDDHHEDDHDEGHDEHHHEHHHDHHDEEEHGGHHHHHHHDEGEAEEYGIGTFVYFRRPAFDINKFDWFVSKRLPKNVIRAKGLCYFTEDPDMSCIFEQAGKQIQLRQAGQWYATAPQEELIEMMRQDPSIMKEWDPHYGDRMQKIVFIGQNMDREQITRDLDACLAPEGPDEQ